MTGNSLPVSPASNVSHDEHPDSWALWCLRVLLAQLCAKFSTHHAFNDAWFSLSQELALVNLPAAGQENVSVNRVRLSITAAHAEYATSIETCTDCASSPTSCGAHSVQAQLFRSLESCLRLITDTSTTRGDAAEYATSASRWYCYWYAPPVTHDGITIMLAANSDWSVTVAETYTAAAAILATKTR